MLTFPKNVPRLAICYVFFLRKCLIPTWEVWEHGGKNPDAEVSKTNLCSNPFPNNCCVTLGKMFNFSEPRFSHIT